MEDDAIAEAGSCRSYVVRVWASGSRFRAEVRDVRRERSVAFRDVEALARFLAAVPRRRAAASAPPPPASGLQEDPT